MHKYELAHFGELVGDPSRAAMLLSLMDGRERPATELALVADVTQSTASLHLKKLLEGGLVAVGQQGRHRYYRIANESVAGAIEAIAPRVPKHVVPLSETQLALKHARTCYKHLAGELGVRLFDSLEKKRMLRLHDGELRMPAKGLRELHLDDLPGKTCVDWTERRSHLGGPLGVRLTAKLFELEWIARGDRDRSIRITTAGRRGFREQFGISA
jgi:DNA-binding transcriptional ArsR family regulator